jgi:hypothetical protein
VIPNYCIDAPDAGVTNSIIIGSYSTKLGDTAIVGCDNGYSASGQSTIATCSANGMWTGLSMTCECTLIR